MTAAELKYLIATDELYNGSGLAGVRLTEIAKKWELRKSAYIRRQLGLKTTVV